MANGIKRDDLQVVIDKLSLLDLAVDGLASRADAGDIDSVTFGPAKTLLGEVVGDLVRLRDERPALVAVDGGA
jgi:hypothetical protein